MMRLVLFALAACTLLAQSDPRYIPFSPSDTKGALYAPDSGPAPTIGVLVIHRTANFMETLACTELSKRGLLVLCMNPRSDNNEAAVRWNDIPLDVKTGVEFLRAQKGIEKVVLWGHSGGGPTTTFYQAVAENGTSYCNTPEKIIPCNESLEGLPPADGVILVDAHPGNSVNVLRSINPAVLNDEEIINHNAEPKLDPSLDALNPANGYDPDGSRYTAEFKTRYFAAQARRMNKLIDIARAKLAAMRAGAYRYSDDDYFPIVQSSGWRLMQNDVSIHQTTARRRRLLKNDGSIVEEIVRSVRVPSTSTPSNSFSRDFRQIQFSDPARLVRAILLWRRALLEKFGNPTGTRGRPQSGNNKVIGLSLERYIGLSEPLPLAGSERKRRTFSGADRTPALDLSAPHGQHEPCRSRCDGFDHRDSLSNPSSLRISATQPVVRRSLQQKQ